MLMLLLKENTRDAFTPRTNNSGKTASSWGELQLLTQALAYGETEIFTPVIHWEGEKILSKCLAY